LLLRVNQALKLNNKAVIDEQLKLNDPHYERRQIREEFFQQKKTTLEHFKGKEYLQESAIAVHKRQRPAASGGPKESYGWDVFNADSIYKAYEKRINKIPKLLQG
jgi:hypothetical protein